MSQLSLTVPDSQLFGQTPFTVHLFVSLSTFLSACHSYLYLDLSCCFQSVHLPLTVHLPVYLFVCKPQLYLTIPIPLCFQPAVCPLPLSLTVHMPVYLFVCKSRLFLSIPVPLFSSCCLSACLLPSTCLSTFSFASHRYLYTASVPLCFHPVICPLASYRPLACLPFRLQATAISTCTLCAFRFLSVPTCLLLYICPLTCPLSCLRFPSIYVCLPDTTFYVPFFLTIDLISPVTFPPLPLAIMFASAKCQLLSTLWTNPFRRF
jgi:hypothetical protein